MLCVTLIPSLINFSASSVKGIKSCLTSIFNENTAVKGIKVSFNVTASNTEERNTHKRKNKKTFSYHVLLFFYTLQLVIVLGR